MPRPLTPGTIYLGDNGRLLCLQCGGASASTTGIDLSGHPVEAMGDADNREWFAQIGEPLACEGGCTHYPIPDHPIHT